MHTLGKLTPVLMLLSPVVFLLGVGLLCATITGHVSRNWEWFAAIAVVLITGGGLTFYLASSIVVAMARAV